MIFPFFGQHNYFCCFWNWWYMFQIEYTISMYVVYIDWDSSLYYWIYELLNNKKCFFGYYFCFILSILNCYVIAAYIGLLFLLYVLFNIFVFNLENMKEEIEVHSLNFCSCCYNKLKPHFIWKCLCDSSNEILLI